MAFNVTGTGQKIGVLSTDDGSMDGGLAASVKSGDLPPNVQTLDDSSGTTDDEGRAMLEQIYDLALKSRAAQRSRPAPPARPVWPRTSTPSSPLASDDHRR